MDNPIIPLIDISPALEGTMEGKRHVARQINDACCDLGFFSITGHGIPISLVNSFRKVSHEFFELPVEKKLDALHPIEGTPRGYRIFAGEALGRAAVACEPSSGGATLRRAGVRPATFGDSNGVRSAARCGVAPATGSDLLGVLVTDWAVATGSTCLCGARSELRSGTATSLWVVLAAGLGVSFARVSALG